MFHGVIHKTKVARYFIETRCILIAKHLRKHELYML